MKKTFIFKVMPLVAVVILGVYFVTSCEKERNTSTTIIEPQIDEDYWMYNSMGGIDTFDIIDSMFVINLREPNHNVLQAAIIKCGHLYSKCYANRDIELNITSPTYEIDSVLAFMRQTGVKFSYSRVYTARYPRDTTTWIWSTGSITVTPKDSLDYLDSVEIILHQYKVPYDSIVKHYVDGRYTGDYIVYLDVEKDLANYYVNRLFEARCFKMVGYNHGFSWLPDHFFHSVNLWQHQWNLNYTGQYGSGGGYDINVLPVWQDLQVTGSSIKVAVVDEGVDCSHFDLAGNISGGYDATYNGSMGNHSGDDAHGTVCAGIISAISNNTGVTGVAFQSQIIPIRIAYYDASVQRYNTFDLWICDGLDYAMYNSDVINFCCDYYDYLSYSRVQSKMTEVCSIGRNQKGCVVVYSVGNGNYERYKNLSIFDSIITVGATNQYGERKTPLSQDGDMTWGSNYGEVLNVMAPGVCIPTTDISDTFGYNSRYYNSYLIYSSSIYPSPELYPYEYDFTTRFSGTSAAAPHVSGVAALMLSANPNLSFMDVKKIIEKTARKSRTDTYTYSYSPSHSNGTWNNEMGYGLVDAYNAVKAAIGYNLYIRDTITDNGSYPSGVRTMDSPDIWLRRSNDGGTTHQNGVNGLNYLHVRIHNSGPGASPTTDTLRVFGRRALLAGSLSWDQNNWTEYAAVPIPEIPIGSSKVVVIPINLTVNYYQNTVDYAFYARIDSFLDTLTSTQASNLLDNVSNNNNISAKNTTVARYGEINGRYGMETLITASSTSNIVTNSNLRINLSSAGQNLLDEAEVTIVFPEDFMNDWTQNYSGIKQIDNNSFIATNDVVELFDIQASETTDLEITLIVNFLTRKNSANDIYKCHVLQYTVSGDDEEIIGLLTIQIEKPERAAAYRFHANAGNDTAVLLNTTATLHATQINENATYRWYDKQRNFLYEGVNYSVIPSQTSEYILEVTAESDGYRDLDTVKVNVVPGCIRSITPNPVSDNWITVSYEYATSVTSAQLYIYNTGTTTLVGNYYLSNLGNVSILDIEVANYPAGSYTVVLVCDNAVCHSKVLIRQ